MKNDEQTNDEQTWSNADREWIRDLLTTTFDGVIQQIGNLTNAVEESSNNTERLLTEVLNRPVTVLPKRNKDMLNAGRKKLREDA